MHFTRAIAAAIIVTVPAAVAAETPLQRETAAWNAVKAKRMAEFKASMSPDFVGMYSWGTDNRAEELKIVRDQTLRSFALSKFRAVEVDADNLLVTYFADVRGVADGDDFSGRYSNTTLWHRAGGKWLTVYHGEAKAK
ncbi:MAG: DUF4440 domain-containing protein [Sphingomicrobium sp.]